MKNIVSVILIIVIIGVVLTGCVDSTTSYTGSVDQQQAVQQEQMQQDMNNQIGLPNIKEWSEKKMMKEILELRDNSKLITYAYLQNLNGKFVFLGQCIGYGLPYSTQYTSPEKVDIVHNGYDAGDNPYTLPQSDPNGLFSAEGVSATWLQYINPDTGEREVMYCEPDVVVTQSKLPKRLVEPWSIPENY